ncbi:MAG: hypothetical protein GF364_20620 [Candidatus Lokiarchaeota archaeon]|nr:hypothetical protein [Candidatus Lokiarchaeota archaeon]
MAENNPIQHIFLDKTALLMLTNASKVENGLNSKISTNEQSLQYLSLPGFMRSLQHNRNILARPYKRLIETAIIDHLNTTIEKCRSIHPETIEKCRSISSINSDFIGNIQTHIPAEDNPVSFEYVLIFEQNPIFKVLLEDDNIKNLFDNYEETVKNSMLEGISWDSVTGTLERLFNIYRRERESQNKSVDFNLIYLSLTNVTELTWNVKFKHGFDDLPPEFVMHLNQEIFEFFEHAKIIDVDPNTYIGELNPLRYIDYKAYRELKKDLNLEVEFFTACKGFYRSNHRFDRFTSFSTHTDSSITNTETQPSTTMQKSTTHKNDQSISSCTDAVDREALKQMILEILENYGDLTLREIVFYLEGRNVDVLAVTKSSHSDIADIIRKDPTKFDQYIDGSFVTFFQDGVKSILHEIIINRYGGDVQFTAAEMSQKSGLDLDTISKGLQKLQDCGIISEEHNDDIVHYGVSVGHPRLVLLQDHHRCWVSNSDMPAGHSSWLFLPSNGPEMRAIFQFLVYLGDSPVDVICETLNEYNGQELKDNINRAVALKLLKNEKGYISIRDHLLGKNIKTLVRLWYILKDNVSDKDVKRAEKAPKTLKKSLYPVLRVLNGQPRALTLSKLRKHIQVPIPTLARMIGELKEHKFIMTEQVTVSPQWGRTANGFKITKQGRQYLNPKVIKKVAADPEEIAKDAAQYPRVQQILENQLEVKHDGQKR